MYFKNFFLFCASVIHILHMFLVAFSLFWKDAHRQYFQEFRSHGYSDGSCLFSVIFEHPVSPDTSLQ